MQTDILQGQENVDRTGGRPIKYLMLADNIDGVAGKEQQSLQ